MKIQVPGTFREIFGVFLRLGLTCFGGPVAHLGFFHEEFVVRRRWLEEADYADLVALCQFLPGPASSQVGMAIGLRRAGWKGTFATYLPITHFTDKNTQHPTPALPTREGEKTSFEMDE